jgi:hypothetical protein
MRALRVLALERLCGWKGLGQRIQPRQHDVRWQAQRIGLRWRALDPCYLQPIRFGPHDVEDV